MTRHDRQSTPDLLSVDGDRFLRGGAPHQIISGAVHYFRIHPDLWEDRLRRLRAMGLNTIETYVAWNLHERRRGTFDFTGMADLERFITIAGDLGLDVIVRPGPFICAEWDFGGLPAWLAADPRQPLRCLDPTYLAAVDAWFDELVPRLARLQRTVGGPVVAVQVENEYGSYGDDAAYLERARKALQDRGIDVLLVTSDGPGPDYFAAGTIPGVLPTANFGSRAEESFAELRAVLPTGPLMCMEYWNGWFDHWGEHHHVRDPQDAARVLEDMLKVGASVNFYMAHGGTNFGLWNGANHGNGYEPTITSYDYDAAVGEAGELTDKFHAFREVISRYAPVPDEALPALPERQSPKTVAIQGFSPLRQHLDLFDEPVRAPMPKSMEDLDQDHGLILYRGSMLVPPDGRHLALDGLRDRAIVMLDGAPVATVSRNDADQTVPLTPRSGGERTTVDVLVENQGRINFGHLIGERKGLSAIRLAHRYIHDWESIAIRLDDPKLPGLLTGAHAIDGPRPAAEAGPVFAATTIDVDVPADAFLALPGWTKGFVWLNGTMLGRYWEIGPQVTLYAPGPLWRCGANELLVLELHEPGDSIEVRSEPELGPTEPQPL